MVQDYNDEIIELTEVVTEESSLNDQGAVELTQELSDGEAILSDGAFLPLDESENIASSLGKEQLEAALERVIEKKFSETIDKLLFEVMEKVIKREIDDMKSKLLKDLDGIA